MADLRDLEESIRARGRELRDAAGEVVLDQTRGQAPRLTGELFESIHAEAFDDGDTLGVDISADAPQALWTDEGTQPHVITASPGKVLAFYWREVGGTVFAKSVNHPGNRAQNWFREPMADRWRIALENAAG